MNNTPVLFNRRILDKYLFSFSHDQITDYDGKRAEMMRWKKAVETGDLAKTKETSVQGQFLAKVFERVLGYTSISGAGGGEWNQVAEYTSALDSSQADGALGFFTADTKIVRAVVELKDAKADLDKKQQRLNHLTPVEQAFNYANKNGSGCGWVIVSNFVEIRLYKSSSSLEYERFILTELDDEANFKRFYFLLCKDHLMAKSGKSLVDRIYDDNEQAQEEISMKFYSDYKKLRTDLYEALKIHNEDINPLLLFSKAQKVLDRFIFICFCENRMLLPQGIFRSVIDAAKNSFVMSQNRLWEQLKGLFHSIDHGNPSMQINGYNGGLFKHDEELDSLIIPDNVLESFQRLAEYDFGSDLNVNILGHIFEYSISDIETVKAEIEGKELERISSKQKTDGIYYTPNYVTKFIVEKTLGRWLADEKERVKIELFRSGEYIATGTTELGKNTVSMKKWEEIADVYEDDRVRYPHAVKKLHIDFWEEYIKRLKTITVLDPACGSGAFLNCAFDYLAEEGRYAQEMHNSLLAGQISFLDWDAHILQNNLYGVDLNAESVEISKLSLWLKTADAGKPLAYLDDNIKTGNSIIADPSVTGCKAFDWNVEFPSIMEKGGFDVVIGNPPYGASLSQEEKDYISASYETTEYNFDTYKTFMELGLKLTRKGGYMGYITPNTYFILEKGANKLRKFFFDNFTLLDIAELFNVFPTAVVEPAISIFRKKPPVDSVEFEVISVPRKTDLSSTFIADGVRTVFMQKDLREREGYIFNYRETETEKKLRKKVSNKAKPLSTYFKVTTGMKPYQVGKGKPKQTRAVVDTKPFEGYERLDETWMEYVKGKSFHRYTDRWEGEYIKYGEWLAEPKSFEMFANTKLFIRQTGDFPIANYDISGKICKDSVHCVHALEKDSGISLKYILGIINSRLMRWIYQYDNFSDVGKTLAQVKKVYVERLPIVVADDQSRVISHVDNLLESCQSKFNKTKQFNDYLTTIYTPIKISEKLSEFYKLDFKSFVEELKKQKAKLNPRQEMELMPLFNEKVAELIALTRSIEKLDSELDEIVYELYKLTEEEKLLVEGGER
jgi:type I restriction-modification system DNA methylase subunit